MTPTDILGALKLPGRVASLLPVVVCGAFLLLILASGPPGADPDADRAWRTLANVSGGQSVLILLGLVLVALLLDPLQLRLTRVLEGDWPDRVGALTRWSIRRQRTRRDRAAAGIRFTEQPSPQEVQEAGGRAARLQRRFPSQAEATRPTALGNALAAMEERAGLRYGWDSVVAWPRLYPLLSPGVRMVIDGQRDRLDGLARLTVTSAATSVISLALLYGSGLWILLAAIPAIVSRLAYVGAVHTAIAYGQAVHVAFDLHRFDLLRRLHMPLPHSLADERKLATQLSLMWRQGVDISIDYEHPDMPDSPPVDPEQSE